MNTAMRPPFTEEFPDKGRITLMWTTLYLPTCPGLGSVWVPDHIVPFAENAKRGPVQKKKAYLQSNDITKLPTAVFT